MSCHRMRILGIDPGLNITGYGCVDLAGNPVGTADPVLVEAGVFRMDNRAPMAHRLRQLHEDLSRLLKELKPQRMVVEELFSHYRHVRTSILMGHARGVILLAGQSCGLEIGELAATEVKKAITGNGHASKEQVQLAVMSQLNLQQPPSPPDVADALAIALCAARRLQTDPP
ncbi:MAG: crossover junction endodeoxyribonuclease RuvC [Phycisphaerales bacterium]|nr:MAG: crossover junction endodeoxyribonuclease RuvC [Phycisphaerales bacterium]